MCFQPLEYDEIVPDARPSGDFLRLEVAIATLEKYKLSSAGLKDCRGEHDQLSSEAGFHIHVHEHARFQLESRICNRQPHTHGAGCHIHLWQDLFDLPGECTPRIRVDGNVPYVAWFHADNVGLEDLGIDPYA